MPRLTQIAPPGTLDPTPTLYNSVMHLMAGLLEVAFLANILLKPAKPIHRMQEDAPTGSSERPEGG